MNEIPNRYEVWVFYYPPCARADWFKQHDCHSVDELVDTLKKTMAYFHDSLDMLDKYVDIRAFRNRHAIRSYRKKPSSILNEFDVEWSRHMDSCMKMCNTCIMNDMVECGDIQEEDGASIRICRDGKPWFGKADCPFYTDDNPWHYPKSQSPFDYVDVIREEMEKAMSERAKPVQ